MLMDTGGHTSTSIGHVQNVPDDMQWVSFLTAVFGMAEREGFEPSIEFPLYTLSKRAPSTTRPSLRFVNFARNAKVQDIRLRRAYPADGRATTGLTPVVLPVSTDAAVSCRGNGGTAAAAAKTTAA